ncbi:response regulator transcription factor [Rubrivivax rivuli]|uniref:Response regulator transcription factor n=1 Tax=Rubrivivax rivuli TaxID=1862385 RepID=A0A437RI27_9BURK|nr:response regulator transcription factor [Rubrivivax rivuli]RVU46389.1 response regulator transcription factor [Rubrivivax rivuli]
MSEPHDPIALLVLDDHAIVRHGLLQLAAQVPWIKACRAAASLDEALALMNERTFDVAVVDLSLGGASGMDAIGELQERWPALRVVVLSMHSDPMYWERAFERGVHAFVAKDDATEQLVEAIARVAQGGIYMGARIQSALAGRFGAAGRACAPRPEALVARLTPREREILEFIGKGLSAAEVAFELERSVKTVEAHKAKLREKLGLRSNQLLLQFAARWVQFDSRL